MWRMFQQINFQSTRIVLPNAPVRPISVNGGYKMQGWYDIYALGYDRIKNPLTIKEDDSGIKDSSQQLSELLDYELSLLQQNNSNKLIVGGFSQGAALSLFTGLQYQKHLQAVIACSGYLLLASQLQSHLTEQSKKLRIFASHGTDDQVVPYMWSKKGYDMLIEQGVNIEFYTDQHTAHSISQQGIQKVQQYILDRLKD